MGKTRFLKVTGTGKGRGSRPFLVAVSGFQLSSDLEDDPCPVRRSLHLADTENPR